VGIAFHRALGAIVPRSREHALNGAVPGCEITRFRFNLSGKQAGRNLGGGKKISMAIGDAGQK